MNHSIRTVVYYAANVLGYEEPQMCDQLLKAFEIMEKKIYDLEDENAALKKQLEQIRTSDSQC